MYLQCDVDTSKEQFERFEKWYFANHPEFKGTIRRAADSLYIAEIIDENQKMRRFRFMKG
jgi:hypothetical protein